ncbi:MAG: cobalamin-binding domain-containing protein [Anaerolineae bacterium]|nr:cobalamin-binding domain-containing protein [Anaerolineae bacterium]
MNVLLVEPTYRSKFPPLGLMRISAFHKERDDAVTFVRGKVPEYRMVHWHRVYIASLFTYELPRTVDTVKYYLQTVQNPLEDVFVGGIGATLLPNYIRERVPCQVIEGPLDRPNMLGLGESPIAEYIPDYRLIDSVKWQYRPENAYFIRVSKGCIRKCKFCAVPILEPTFGYLQSVNEQLEAVRKKYGERQDIILLDNNILALPCLPQVIQDIREQGFHKGAKWNGKKRIVDFNQGIDARLITHPVADLLSSVCLSPVRLAFDYDAVEFEYRRAVHLLAEKGFIQFTTYVMFNFEDTPESFYRRLRVNLELSNELDIRVTGFPMRYVPIDDVDRHFVSVNWTWRYLRGIQCVLNATHGMVSPNPTFFEAAFGKSYEEFLEVIAMPDRYIIYRNQYASQADVWRSEYRKLSEAEKREFLEILGVLHSSRERDSDIVTNSRFSTLIDHYYPKTQKML